ncbi:DNA repair protein RecO [bacterium]|nr:DNA repair protein RecO [bacterium]
MAHSQANNYLALVIKTQRLHERDLIVTLLTREQGKITTVAKGVRHLSSSKRAFLEGGNLIHAQLITTKNWPLLTQAQLVADASSIRTDLIGLKKFLLFLEILDRLLVSEELSPELFEQILYLRQMLLARVRNDLVAERFQSVLDQLGFGRSHQVHASINQQVNQILDDNLRSFEYFQV